MKLDRLNKLCLNETYSEVCRDMWDGLIQEDALSLVYISLKYDFKKVKENIEELKLNGT
jgi:hypothetical protein